jgi:hypothetical protein
MDETSKQLVAETRLPISAQPGSFFHFFVEASTEPEIVAMLSASRRPLDETDLRKYFVEVRPLLAEALPEQRAAIEDRYLPYALRSM